MTLTGYTGLVSVTMIAGGYTLSVAILFLCVIPLLVMLYERPLQLSSLLGAVGVGGVMLVLIAATGQVTGAWYGVVVTSWQWAGVSFETILFALVHTLYLLVLYEFFFDDGRGGQSLQRHVLPAMTFLAALCLTFVYLFAVAQVTFAFAWILMALLGVLFVTLALSQPRGLWQLLPKVLFFAVVTWPLSFAIELVALWRETQLFAFSSEYLGELTLGGVVIPYEQILLMFVWPFVLAIIYELFVDDGE
jgi:hypothetical protein